MGENRVPLPGAVDLLRDLLRGLTAYTEHRGGCPSEHGWRVDEHGVRIPCSCGLDELLREVRELVSATGGPNSTNSEKG